MYYMLVFYIYSIIGYIFEIIVNLVRNAKPSSSILFGPWTPIYGFGVLIMLFVKRKLKKLKLNKILELIVYFIVITIIITVLEQIGGLVLRYVFDKTLWDYSNLRFHITKYIALETSLGWGLLSILVAYVIHPKLKKIIAKIPFWIFVLITILFSIDVAYTIVKFI